MSAYFTTHHFSPKWSSTPSGRRESSTNSLHLPPLTTTTITAPSIASAAHHKTTTTVNGDHEHPLSSSSTHGLHGLDSLAHFLHVFNSHYNNEDGVTQHGVVHPHFDLAENNTLYVIYGELAGLSKKDVHVEVNDALFIITISGKIVRLAAPGSLGLPINDSTPETVGVVHREGDDVGTQTGEAAVEGGEAGKRQEDDLHWHVTERRVGSFRRAFQFSAESVDVAGVSATMTNGLLCVLVPKRERKAGEGEGRKVEIS